MGAVPPFIGVAVQLTGEPGQNGFGEAVIEIPAGSPTVPIIDTGLLDAGLLDVQSSEDVSVQVTTSPETGL
jgi:hypothetical protein